MPDSEEQSDVRPTGAHDDATPLAESGGSEAPLDESASRRNFVVGGVGALGACYVGVLGYPVYRYLATPAQRAADLASITEISLKDADKLEPGTALMFRFGTRPAMLIHQQDGTWTALSAVCTHLGCTVQYQADQDRIFCACHSGVYDAKTGTPVSGPPPKGLEQYSVEVKDGEVIVSRG